MKKRTKMAAPAFPKRRVAVLGLALCGFFLIAAQQFFSRRSAHKPYVFERPSRPRGRRPPKDPSPPDYVTRFSWADVPPRYPVQSVIQMPQPFPDEIPRIQHTFPEESEDARLVRTARLEAIKDNFTHAWTGYKSHAWMHDEVTPLTGRTLNTFGAWAATLIDSLDTLWIMGLYNEFEDAVQALDHIDFRSCSLKELNVFETTIRFLGGLLAAYDISGQNYPSLLRKATELGDMLYVAFDTPNRMPITRWKFKDVAWGSLQDAADNTLAAEIGSLTMEFTRLSQLTEDPRYFDAIQRVMDTFDQQQNKTKLPGMWPVVVNANNMNFRQSSQFTLGGMADSLYEYLPKQHILLGGGSQQYRKLYSGAMVPIKRNILFRPMTKNGEDILLPGDVTSNGKTSVTDLKTEPRAQHLACFAGGMVALGAKVFDNEEEMDVARKLVEGCLWGFETANMGIMPEVMHTVRCDDRDNCPWDPKKWRKGVDIGSSHGSGDGESESESKSVDDTIQNKHLPPGVTKIDDSRYILRPEAIESIFVLYRLTGDPSLPERAWKIFTTIVEHTTTPIAHAGLRDCTDPDLPKTDRMESFWLAETLKYFYLIFSDPSVVSLDNYVFNTEAHPFLWRS